MEGDELLTIQELERRLGLARPRVRMIAEQHPAERAVRQRLRGSLLLLHALQMLLFENGQLVFGERRIHRHVGDEIDEARRVFGESAGRDRCVILRRCGGNPPTHAERIAPDLPAGLRLRAFLNQVGGQRRQPGLIRRIARVAGENAEQD